MSALAAEDRLRFWSRTAFGILLAYQTWCYRNVEHDDAYIFYVYARNLARGAGYVFNEGERIFATTSPLYTLLLAVGERVLGELPFVTLPGLGHAVSALSLLAIGVLASRLFAAAGLALGAALVPLLVIGVPWIRSAIGMDVLPALALALASLDRYQRGRLGAASALAALAVLARPDTLILPALCVLDHALRNRRLPPRRCLLIFAATLAPWLIFSALYFGTLLPETLAAKQDQGVSGRWGEGWLFLRGFASDVPGGWRGLAPLALALGVSLPILAAGRSVWSGFRGARLVFLWLLLYGVAYGVVLNVPAYPWYYTPFALGVGFALALAAEVVGRSRLRARVGSPLHYAGALLVLALGAGALLPTYTLATLATPKYASYRQAAQWLDANAPVGSRLGAYEIGILGYWFERGPIVDGLGLVTPGVSTHVRRRDFSWWVEQHRPEFLVFDHPQRPLLEAMVEEPWFEASYERATILRSPARAVAIYRRR